MSADGSIYQKEYIDGWQKIGKGEIRDGQLIEISITETHDKNRNKVFLESGFQKKKKRKSKGRDFSGTAFTNSLKLNLEKVKR